MSKPISKLTKTDKAALEYFNLDYAKSDEPGAGWFAYDQYDDRHPDYPGSSCECLEDVVRWYLNRGATEVTE